MQNTNQVKSSKKSRKPKRKLTRSSSHSIDSFSTSVATSRNLKSKPFYPLLETRTIQTQKSSPRVSNFAWTPSQKAMAKIQEDQNSFEQDSILNEIAQMLEQVQDKPQQVDQPLKRKKVVRKKKKSAKRLISRPCSRLSQYTTSYEYLKEKLVQEALKGHKKNYNFLKLGVFKQICNKMQSQQGVQSILREIGWGAYQRNLIISLNIIYSCLSCYTMILALIVKETDFISTQEKGTLGFIGSFASIFGAFFTNKLMVKHGKTTVLYPIVLLPLFGLFFINQDINFTQVALGVSLIGLGQGGILIVSNNLLLESMPIEDKKYLTLLTLGANLGGFLNMGIASYFSRQGFTGITLIQEVVKAFYLLGGICLIATTFPYESPQFLYEQGETEKLKKVLLGIAIYNGKKLENVEIQACDQQTVRPGLKELFGEKYRRNTILLLCSIQILMLVVFGFIIFFPSFIPLESKQAYIIIGITHLLGIPSKLSLPYLLERISYRPLIFISMLFFSTFSLLIPITTDFYLSLVVAIIVSVTSNIGAGTMLGMIPTLYDEQIRGLATALIFGTLRIPGLISPIMTSAMLQQAGSFFVMCVYAILGVISTLLMLSVKY